MRLLWFLHDLFLELTLDCNLHLFGHKTCEVDSPKRAEIGRYALTQRVAAAVCQNQGKYSKLKSRPNLNLRLCTRNRKKILEKKKTK